MTDSFFIPRIALTAGEPAGIGMDLCIQLAQTVLPCEVVVIADPNVLEQRAKQLNLPLQWSEFNPQLPPRIASKGHLIVLPVDVAKPVQTGVLNVANGEYVLKTLTLAVQGCMQKTFDALVTAPVHKGIINDAGFSFTGHTEFIAELTGGYPVMMLATEGLRVALATTHIPLSQVSQTITASLLEQVIIILERDLRDRFHLPQPRIAVCGLNPHAGENGHLGREEIDTINLTLDKLRQQGLNVIGTLPADTVFTDKYLNAVDAVLAMYHDQGLPVLKYKGFGNAVNITLGLPIIRTSVDHGTALELAGTGQANCGSLHFAIETALKMILEEK